MDFNEFVRLFLKAQESTRILRARKQNLYTFGDTRLPYVFLAGSDVNEGEVVVRRGEVTVEKPKIVTLQDLAKFHGFEIEIEEAVPVALNRLIHFPPANYQNKHSSLDIASGPMEAAVERVINRLDQENDTRTGVIAGESASWNFHIIGYVGQMISKSASENVGEYFERYGR